MSIRTFVRPHGTTRLQLDEFSLNSLFEYFRRCVDNVQVSLKPGNNNGALLEVVEFMITSRPILLRMENVLDKRCRKTLANDQLDAQFLYFIMRLLQSSTFKF